MDINNLVLFAAAVLTFATACIELYRRTRKPVDELSPYEFREPSVWKRLARFSVFSVTTVAICLPWIHVPLEIPWYANTAASVTGLCAVWQFGHVVMAMLIAIFS